MKSLNGIIQVLSSLLDIPGSIRGEITRVSIFGTAVTQSGSRKPCKATEQSKRLLRCIHVTNDLLI